MKVKIIAWGVIVSVLASSALFLSAIKHNSRMETDLDEHMPKNHPAFIYSDQAEDWFNIQDGILIAIENKSGIFNPQTLQKIKDMDNQLQKMNEFDANDITSLYSADNITGSEYGMEVEPFYTQVPQSAEEIQKIREKVRANDMVFKRMVSEDETVALIVAAMNDSTFTESFYHEIMAFAHSFESDTEHIYVAGRPIVEGTIGQLGPADMKRMVPIVLAIIALVLFLLLRSARAATATLLTVFISTIWAFGLMAVLGVPIYSVSTMIPVMLIAIGVAYGVYFYNHLNQYQVKNPAGNRYDAVKQVIKSLWKPLAMAAFTTMIGFISLLTSQVYPIKYFGIFTAFGIFSAFILALAFLPAVVMIFGYRTKKITGNQESPITRKLNCFTAKILQKRKTVYWVLALIIAISAIGITKVWINSSFLDKFEKNSEIVQTDHFVNSKFGGTSTLNVILETKTSDAFKQPANLKLIDDMQNETEQLDKVGNSFSLADYLKRMNKVMNADDDDYYAIPENTNLVAQYLLLYEMSGDPDNLTKVTNYDYTRTNITFQLKGDDSKTINEALAVIQGYSDQFAANDIQINYAGSGYKSLIFSDLILEGQIKSIILSLGLVLLLLTLMFRSLKAGLIGSIPIIITSLISFGIMGLLNIPLSTTTALLSSIAIGIGIDYAIHFIQHYRMSLSTIEKPMEALQVTMGHTGKAIFFNAVVVIAGFLVLVFSVFPPNRTLGALVSMNMFTSFVGTLSIMMILLYTSNVFLKTHHKQKK